MPVTYLCARCKQEHSVSSIAFSMPDTVYQSITQTLQKAEFREINKKITKNSDRLKCITVEDVKLYMEGTSQQGTTMYGKLRLTGEWLRKRLEECGIDCNKLSVDLQTEIYSEDLCFEFATVGDDTVPVRISTLSGAPISEERRCPHCGKVLCKATGTAPEIRVVFQGSSRAGKTSCMIAMIHELLQKDPNADTGISINSLDAGRDKQLANLKEELAWYCKGYMVKKTEDDALEPYVYSVPLVIDKKPMVLTMVDMPGEFFDGNSDVVLGPDWFDQYAALYTHCDAIWTSMQYHMIVSEDLSSERINRITERTGAEEDHIANATFENYNIRFQEIKKYCDTHGHQLPPHAMILSKTDSHATLLQGKDIQDVMARSFIFEMKENPADFASPSERNYNSLIKRRKVRGREQSVYSEEDAYRIASLVKGYFQSINSRVVSLCTAFNSSTSYFALSAYGNSPKKRPDMDENGCQDSASAPRCFTPEPYNVCLPLLWTLAVSGHLPVAYRETTYRNRNFFEVIRMGQGMEKVSSNTKIVTVLDGADRACFDNLFLKKPAYSDHLVIEK